MSDHIRDAEFIQNREGYLVSRCGNFRECTSCRNLFRMSSAMGLCHLCNSDRVKSGKPEYRMWNRAKQRAKAKGMVFSITVEDIWIPDTCPVMGMPLVIHSGKSGAYRDSPSLDRIDNEEGYTKENIQVISQLANSMKGAATVPQLLAFANYILEVYGENN